MQSSQHLVSSQTMKPFPLIKYSAILMIVWTVIIISSLSWSIYQARQKFIEVAQVQSRIAYEKDVIYRRWNSIHGGVYVPVSPETSPNPYLKNIDEREIITDSGRTLTLMNPAFMTRQVHELAEKTHGVLGHITSLNPIRPENAADPWEIKALQAFELGETEVSSLESINDREYLRLMRPLITETGCLKCHEAQGYRQGDIRGGISVSIPMESLNSILEKDQLRYGFAHSIIWAAGIGFVFLGMYQIKSSETHRKLLEEDKENLILKLQTTLNEIKILQGFIPICSKCKKIRNDEGYWEQLETYISERTDAEFSHSICKTCADEYYPGLLDNSK